MGFHMSMFFGILLTMLATSSAAVIQHIIGYFPPYPILSLPVLSGTIGGFMIIVGALGFLYMKAISDKKKADDTMIKMDYWVVYLLMLTAITGMLSLVTRTSSIMGLIFLIHLSFVGTLFIVTPYSKLNHIVFRYLALVKDKSEIHTQLKAVKTTAYTKQG
jgi:citrate/tricarballylate utilization protein